MPAAPHADDPALASLLARALDLHPLHIDLTLGRLERLLAALGNPEARLPPVFHVAGTNGKGSTCAYLRACLEAAGYRVHAYTSPHLVRFNERIRLAGRLIADDALKALLEEVLAVNLGQPITFFELTTAAAFHAFANTPADACVIEVGLGGRMDATNVIGAPAITGITQLGLDHQQFLGETLVDIAAEKAGIAKHGVPLILSRYPQAVNARIAEVAAGAGAPLIRRGADWDVADYDGALHYRDVAGRISLPLPRLQGAHQIDNAGLALAMLRHQQAVPVPEAALRAGLGWAEWPARLQRLEAGALLDRLPAGSELWLDGGHNPAAGQVVADAFRGHNLAARPFYMVLGMLNSKDAGGFLKPFAGRATAVYTVPIAGHDARTPQELVQVVRTTGLPAEAVAGLDAALDAIAQASDRDKPPVVLITGSLYLAGEALRAHGYVPA